MTTKIDADTSWRTSHSKVFQSIRASEVVLCRLRSLVGFYTAVHGPVHGTPLVRHIIWIRWVSHDNHWLNKMFMPYHVLAHAHILFISVSTGNAQTVHNLAVIASTFRGMEGSQQLDPFEAHQGASLEYKAPRKTWTPVSVELGWFPCNILGFFVPKNWFLDPLSQETVNFGDHWWPSNWQNSHSTIVFFTKHVD